MLELPGCDHIVGQCHLSLGTVDEDPVVALVPLDAVQTDALGQLEYTGQLDFRAELAVLLALQPRLAAS